MKLLLLLIVSAQISYQATTFEEKQVEKSTVQEKIDEVRIVPIKDDFIGKLLNAFSDKNIIKSDVE
uniref:Uncharacterized protein n=1 Tax=Romanomermis culicivorax TaxID=13658 RepID=A0A915L9Z5_ROMCU